MVSAIAHRTCSSCTGRARAIHPASGLAVIIVIASFLLSACTPAWNLPAPQQSTGACLDGLGAPAAPVTGVFVQPDDGYAPVVDEIDAARCTLDLTMYMLTDDVIFDALTAADARDVRVRVILDQHPFGMFGDQQEAFDRLEGRGVEVQWGESAYQFTHAKYMVIDARVAVIMNQNFTGAAFDGNREFGVITTHPEEVAQAADVFASDWAADGASPAVPGPLVVSPDNARQRVLELIGSADRSIDVYAEVIRDVDVLAALRAAERRGVQVRLIMNASLDPEDIAAVEALVGDGVEVRLMETLYIHAKAMTVDGETSLIGSVNYSMTSLDRNREVAMVVDDPLLVSRVIAVYERDWARSVPVES